MRVIMECPRCGQENARALQHCWACGEWLHGTSPLVGACPNCRMPVRESELVCANCGIYLDARLKEEGGPSLPEEKRLGARARKIVVRPARATARFVSPAFLCAAIGLALLVVAIVRGALAWWAYGTSTTPDEGVFAFYAAVLWSALGVVAVILLIIAGVLRHPER
jgi:hypothetical protein